MGLSRLWVESTTRSPNASRAIEVDPAFGNPYNDIGAYLIAKGELDEAIQWLEKAKLAPRYDPRHYPFMNLGRIYAAKGMVKRAIEEFEGALAFAPGDPTCVRAGAAALDVELICAGRCARENHR